MVYEYELTDGVAGLEYPLTYNGAGSLESDAGRRIARIDYDMMNNPIRIQFTNGNVTRYIYSATGEKLRVTHYVAMPNITREFGVKPEGATYGQIIFSGRKDYLLGGNMVLQEERIDKVFFDGGYFKATLLNTVPSTTYGFTLYYHNKDHLGNIREVLNVGGTVQQVTNYYPCGAPYADPAAVSGADFQPYKYNGKELDKMHGLNTYDYGARQYYSILGRWDRVDPLCEKYYSISPYVYCLGNPMNAIDPDGRRIVMFQENSQEYNDYYNSAISYLKEHGCSEIIEYLETINVDIIIKEIGDNEQNYTNRNLDKDEIGWKSKEGLLTDTGQRLSPAIRLFHELVHQEHKLKNPESFLEDTKPNGSDYYTKDDEIIIKNEETVAARNCGEIPNNAVSRESHGGIPYNASSSTSRDIVNPSEAVKFWLYTWE